MFFLIQNKNDIKKKKLGIFYLILCLAIFFFAFYRSEIINEGSLRLYYSLFYFISLFFFLLFIITLKISFYKSVFIAKILFSVLIFLYFIEGFIFIKSKYLFENSEYFSHLNFEEKINDFKKDDLFIDRSITISPDKFLVDKKANLIPFSNMSNKLNFYCKQNKTTYSYFNSDKYGFNNPENVWENQLIDTIIVGDDFAMGACQNNPNDFASNLRNKKLSVLNLSSTQTEILLWYATLREYVNNFKFKNIVIVYLEDEIADLNREIKNNKLIRYLNDETFSQDLIQKQNKIDILIKNKILSFYKKKLLQNNFKTDAKNFLKLYRVRNYITNLFFSEKKPFNEFEIVLKKIKLFAKKNDSNLYFLYVPLHHKYLDNNYNDTDYVKIMKILQKNEVDIIDVHKELNLNYKNFHNYFSYPNSPQNSTYNKFGHEQISNLVFKNLKKD